MSSDFSRCVDQGINLSRRLYYGKNTIPPLVHDPSSETLLPTAVTVYAVIEEPYMVDNPDVPSYQPYVHGVCDPPALVPLHMREVKMKVDCWLDTAFVTVTGSWRVHCVMPSKSCDCCVAVPMGEKGSLLGVEVDINGSSRKYNSNLVTVEEANDIENFGKSRNGQFLKSQIYTIKIPQVDGGSVLSVKVSWFQKLLYQDGQFCLDVPFTFPVYVNPVDKKVSKKEKLYLNVNAGINREVMYSCTSHPLRVLNQGNGRLSCCYEAEVQSWSQVDFNFSYKVSTDELSGGVLLQSPPLSDLDERGMFCFYMFPGTKTHREVFRRNVVFVIDTSRSMLGGPLEDVKKVLVASIYKLNPEDTFNIVTFNEEINLFSSSMELATVEAVSNATRWLGCNLNATGGTNILLPLKQALALLAETTNGLPLIFLVTDGSVEDEKEICNVIKSQCKGVGAIYPRISTFGIGSFCNHYFLQMLAQLGKGHHDSTIDADLIETRMQRLFTTACSVILADVAVDALKDLDSLELYPSDILDLSFGSPIFISGRYEGDFPDSVKVRGTLADMSNFNLELKVQKAKDMPLDRVVARRQIDALTAQAWFLKSKQLEEKVAKLSIQTGLPSEYTSMILLKLDGDKNSIKPTLVEEAYNRIMLQKKMDLINRKIIFLGSLGVGFGNLGATINNFPPGIKEPESLEGAELLVKAATTCCSSLVDRFCCMCFLNTCSQVNDQCSIVLAQLCAALACFECVSCCCEICDCLSL